MKKIVALFLMVLLLTACGQEVKNGFTYAKGVVDYLGDLNEFKSAIPQLTGETLIDPAKREEIKTTITEMRKDIKEFNALTPPSELQTMHYEIVDKNTLFDSKLELALNLIESGEKGTEKLKKLLTDNIVTDLIQSLTEINNKENGK